MPVYNVSRQVVDLVEAESPRAAEQALTDRLMAAGFEVVEGSLFTFEDEDQTPLAER